MRDEYLQEARKVIPDANILINVVSKREAAPGDG